VDLYGRVGSLLEVGTGFHPELSGRENIFLYGAILGMRQQEINRKFDEIVDFAEVKKFLDTPVKHYSSGMYVRLAFAVAAHLEPEILLVDEVLAVGDAAFQKKCLGKMGEVSQTGRTVLFVSHNLVAMQSLCNYAIWLDKGCIKERGLSSLIATQYQNTLFEGGKTERIWDHERDAPGNEQVRIRHIFLKPQTEAQQQPLSVDDAFEVCVEFWSLKSEQELAVTLHVLTADSILVFSTSTIHNQLLKGFRLPKGLFIARCRVPANFLNDGQYRVKLLVVENQSRVIYNMEDAITFEIIDSPQHRGAYFGKRPGVLAPLLDWSMDFVEK
jgi:lipopolysaccharide transport system ATP-binding protein